MEGHDRAKATEATGILLQVHTFRFLLSLISEYCHVPRVYLINYKAHVLIWLRLLIWFLPLQNL